MPWAVRSRKRTKLGQRDPPNEALYVLIGWRVVSFPSSPSSQWSRCLSCDTWAGQRRAPSLLEPLSCHGRTQSLHGELSVLCIRGMVPVSWWGEREEDRHGQVAALQTPHSPQGPRLTLFRSICRDVLSKVGDLPTAHPSWCCSVNRTGRWAVRPALQRAWQRLCFHSLGTAQPHEDSLDLEDGRDQREGELGQPSICVDGETGSERQREWLRVTHQLSGKVGFCLPSYYSLSTPHSQLSHSTKTSASHKGLLGSTKSPRHSPQLSVPDSTSRELPFCY